MRMTPLIAFRHLRMRLRSTLLTAAGVAVGVTVMCTMASLLLGLQTQFVENVVENTPNITIEDTKVGRITRPIAVPTQEGQIVVLSRRPPPQEEEGIVNYATLIHRVEGVPGVVAAAPNLTGQMVLRYGTRGQPVQVTGIVPAQQARAVAWASRLTNQRGQLETRHNGMVIGTELAKNLGIPAGAYVTLVAGPERRQRGRVVAFYRSGIRQVDETSVFVNLRLAQQLLDQPSEASEIAVRIHDVNAAPAIAPQLEAVTGYRARSWQEVNAVFFSVFRIQNTMTTLMIAFIVVIAGFGITNGLITLILEKQRDIGILKAIGTTNNRIVAIFVLEGLVMGLLGAVLGMLLATVTINYLDHMPLRGEGELSTETTFTMLRVPGVYLIPAMVAVVISLTASLIPVQRAARYDPVAIIRSAK